MPTGSPLMPRVQTPSHWLSCGQTRPHTAGREEDCAMHLIGALKILGRDFCNKGSGIWMLTGQPATQGRFLQFRQRFASPTAISGV
jgi:hypothetical protein